MFGIFELLQGYRYLKQQSDLLQNPTSQSFRSIREEPDYLLIDHPGFPQIKINTKDHTLSVGNNTPIQFLHGTFSKHLSEVLENSTQVSIKFSTDAVFNLNLTSRTLTLVRKGETLLNFVLENARGDPNELPSRTRS